jgi:hypothetical protein
VISKTRSFPLRQSPLTKGVKLNQLKSSTQEKSMIEMEGSNKYIVKNVASKILCTCSDIKGGNLPN